MTEMDGDGRAVRQRQRARGFPVMPLPKAVEAIRIAGKYGMQHPRTAFAGYVGHKTPDSGPFKQKLAALRDFGLIEGGGDVTFTALGQRLALPTSADTERDDLLSAFKSATVFWELYEQSAKGVELDREHLAASAVHRIGISAQNRLHFVESFVESGEIVGLVQATSPNSCRLLPLGDRAPASGRSDAPVATASGASGTSATPHTGANPAPFRTDIRIARPVADGEVSFRLQLAGDLPPELYPQLQAVAEAVERLAAGIRDTSPGPEAPSPDEAQLATE